MFQTLPGCSKGSIQPSGVVEGHQGGIFSRSCVLSPYIATSTNCCCCCCCSNKELFIFVFISMSPSPHPHPFIPNTPQLGHMAGTSASRPAVRKEGWKENLLENFLQPLMVFSKREKTFIVLKKKGERGWREGRAETFCMARTRTRAKFPFRRQRATPHHWGGGSWGAESRRGRTLRFLAATDGKELTAVWR